MSVVGYKKRERAIDLFKGLLVIGMVYCHSLQFFSDQQVYPVGQRWIDLINLITFSGIVFSFGYVSQLAYYTKSFRQATTRMLLAASKTLAAFYLSGIAYRLFIDGRLLAWESIRPILWIEEMPGWSEFLLSFTYLMLAGLVLFVPLKWLVERKRLGFAVAGLLLATTFIPYASIHNIKLGPLIGTRDFASFPIVQYFPYYLTGMLFARHRIVWDGRVFTGAATASGMFVLKWLLGSERLPERFPPSIGWIMGPALLLYGMYLLSRLLQRYPRLLKPVEMMGSNVLWFLVMSNMLIFALKGNQQPYNFRVGALGALGMTAAILAVTGFGIWIITVTPKFRADSAAEGQTAASVQEEERPVKEQAAR
ncbi:hypothetical protein [Paenibacillus wynnii]|uniref:Acyltransferase 3 domain-containing protein n=1 Tax=Paenibacillus wynnii TaxID=268407 RepID=A0A098MAH2_9BACL|nr:hypothetical protein [Paenibacillus wynnii]KGE19056.1 hypothetical protein PWYN_06610 [Paenibacillus wynnii]